MAKWKTLQHHGILFPPAYESKGIKIKIRGEDIEINLVQEEMIYQWAKKKDTPYAQDNVFQKNFTSDFAKALKDPRFKGISYEDIDFTDAYRLVDKEKDARDMMTKEERKDLAAQRKKKREQLKEAYGTAIIDGSPVDVANYMAEPPGIFIGRGAHPLRGRWKLRITAKDVTLNLGKGATVPEGDWAKIVHRHDAMWLASWVDMLTQNRKYVWLADTAGLKQDMDKAKYEKAVMLASKIGKVKSRITKDMKSNDSKKSRIATVCYLIYRTAMRVGDEKDPDEADTVGATTLRREHINITENTIEFDFLGKDSIRWQETLKMKDEHDMQFKNNLEKIAHKKGPHDEIFDRIKSRNVNKYYSSIIKGLSAKVFRTYLATTEVKKYLVMHDDIKDRSAHEKLYHAKMANLNAAIMCNHKRTIPKTFETSLQKKRDTLKKVQSTPAAVKSKESLKKAERSEPKTQKQIEQKTARIKRIKETIKKQTQRHKERIEKISLQIDLTEKTRDYNLGTSLRNYIDPRIFMIWSNEVDAQWEKMYTAALQKKFLWVKNENVQWSQVKQAQ